MLKPVIQKFVNAKRGKMNKTFWNKIVNFNRGCGVDSVSGWITVFSAFNTEGVWKGT